LRIWSEKMNEWMNDPEAFSQDFEELQALLAGLHSEPEQDEDEDMDEDEVEYFEDDCPLDGDAESALASAGFGTDEDYGYYGGEE
jgi:hypothetical protein